MPKNKRRVCLLLQGSSRTIHQNAREEPDTQLPQSWWLWRSRYRRYHQTHTEENKRQTGKGLWRGRIWHACITRMGSLETHGRALPVSTWPFDILDQMASRTPRRSPECVFVVHVFSRLLEYRGHYSRCMEFAEMKLSLEFVAITVSHSLVAGTKSLAMAWYGTDIYSSRSNILILEFGQIHFLDIKNEKVTSFRNQ